MAQHNSPKLFAPGVISGAADELSPAFTPDGKTVLFTRSNGTNAMIMVSTLTGDQWSRPKIAQFSGRWNDFEPTMSPDGKFLVFASNRPAAEGGKPLDGFFNGKPFPGRGGNLWRVDRVANGWSEPKRLPDEINVNASVFSPSIAADGSIYFMDPDKQTGLFRIYRSQFRNGHYETATAMNFESETDRQEVDPAVAADESFVVYSSSKPSAKEPSRLKICRRTNGKWGPPVDLGDEVNEEGSNIEARLGADGRTLYFSTNTVPPVQFPRSATDAERDLEEMSVWADGRQNIWWVSLEPWLGGR